MPLVSFTDRGIGTAFFEAGFCGNTRAVDASDNPFTTYVTFPGEKIHDKSIIVTLNSTKNIIITSNKRATFATKELEFKKPSFVDTDEDSNDDKDGAY
jgi:hypothetical protein